MNLIAGLALGAAIGLFTGLSVSPVVGAFLTTLSALLVAFLSFHKAEPTRFALLRVTGFGFGCLAAGVAGIYLRANNVLGLTPARALGQWRQAGLGDLDLARTLKTHLEAELAKGRSLAEITLMTTPVAEPAAKPGKSDAAHKEHRMVGGAGFFAQEDTTQLDSLLDQLAKNPSWTSARQEAADRLQIEPSRLAWIERASGDDHVRVRILKAWLEEAKRRS